jgi:hypothetical protein
MNYTQTRTITIETQDEQPLLGQNVLKVGNQRLNEKMNHALKEAIEDGRPTQTIKVGNTTFVVRIQDTIRHIK